MACSFGSLKTEAGLQELNDHLASRSFLGGGAHATQEDFEWFAQAPSAVDAQRFPHARRWCQHLGALRAAFPRRQWPRAAGSATAAGSSGAGGSGEAGGGRVRDQARLEGLLPNAERGRVCTRFPPEPSGYLHIGHAKAAMLNNHYARHYDGKLILRFDDTNPSKEKSEFEDSIKADLATLEIFPDQVSHTSDYFDQLQARMEDLIKRCLAYVDDTDVDQMRQERDAGVASSRRDQSREENLRLWGEMLRGSGEGQRCCVRAKIDMKNKNKCLRDPVFYRCKVDVPHHRTGLTYKAYPTYDFACPVVDSLEGVTHALRTIEYKDRDAMYHWVLEATGSRRVELVEFSKTQFSHTVLSKRKLTLFVGNGWVEGWDDPRFPTVQGVIRRGMTVEGLREFVLTQGMSKATNLMEWDKIWAINKQKIDPAVPRSAAVASSGAVVLSLDGPPEPVGTLERRHPKNEGLGLRLVLQAREVWLEQEDAGAIQEGEEVTLLHWGNVRVSEVHRDPEGGVLRMAGRLNPGGSVKDTKKKIHWVPKLDDQVTRVVLREYDHLVTKAKIEDTDSLESIINERSVVDTPALGDPLLKTFGRGDKLQLERRGYFIVDSVAFPPGRPMVLIKIPDGRSKDMSMTSKVDPSKLVGAQGRKADVPRGQNGGVSQPGDGKEQQPAPAGGPEDQLAAKASTKPAGKDAAPKAPARPAERPLGDVSRLDVRVGRVVKVWPHETAEKLYCEMIDLDEAGGPRTVASGLRAHLREEDLLDQLVVVLANLKPRKMQGFDSQGMVLCATSADGRVELMQPPPGARVGERVLIEGVEMGAPDEKLNEKAGKAPWEVLRPGCRTNACMQGTYNGALWSTSAGPVSCRTVADGQIS